MDPLDYLLTEDPVIWVFGYGSLLWKPDFSYKSKVIGFIEGYERRFNQGNETFRGVPGKPGRVANLEQKSGCKTWGVAYEISGRREVSRVLQDLYIRESRCGGYDTMITTFYPREYADKSHPNYCVLSSASSDSSDDDVPRSHKSRRNSSYIKCHRKTTETVSDNRRSSHSGQIKDEAEKSEVDSQKQYKTATDFQSTPKEMESREDHPSPSFCQTSMDNSVTIHPPVQVLLYTATQDNDLYLGSDDTLSNIAHQIVDSIGTAGTNVEYVLKITEYIRKYIPEDNDEYLFALDAKIREELYRRINLQRTEPTKDKDVDLEHHEALLNAIRIRAS